MCGASVVMLALRQVFLYFDAEIARHKTILIGHIASSNWDNVLGCM